MSDLTVQTRTQRIIVQSQQRIVVEERVARVFDSTTGVQVIPAGPQGPPGVQGLQGEPGQDSGAYVDDVIYAHVHSPTPHPVYDDDLPNLTIHFENGLL